MFATPLGLLALLAVPAVLALHLLRRRSRPRAVSSLELWAGLVAPPSTGRRIERLQRSASLYLELAAALLLALAIAGPRGCAHETRHHLVLVLDASASMTARDRGGESAEARARAFVRERVAALSGVDRVTIVETGVEPRLLGDIAGSAADVARALARWTPGLRAHDVHTALSFARDLVGPPQPGERVEYVLVTDRFQPARIPDHVGIVAVGAPVENAGIVAAWRGAHDGHTERVEVTAVSFASARRDASVVVRDGTDAVLETRRVTLAPRERTQVAFEIAGAADAVLRIAVEGADDGFAADDVAPLAPAHVAPLLVAADDDAAFRSALGLGAGLEHFLALARPASIAQAGLADLVLTADGTAVHPAAITVHLAARGEERSAWIAPFLIERGHPLLDGVELRGSLWLSSAEGGARGSALVSAGNHVLMGVRGDGAGAVVELDVDVARSTWLAGPDWPLLLANLAAWRRAHGPTPRAVNLAPGEPLVVARAPPGVWRLTESGRVVSEVRIERMGEFSLATPRQPTTLVLEHDGDAVARVAVALLDADASDLATRASGRRDARLVEAPGSDPSAQRERKGLAAWLLAGALAACLADAAVLSRGRRIAGARTS